MEMAHYLYKTNISSEFSKHVQEKHVPIAYDNFVATFQYN
jgi:hypothetical protein